MKELVDLIKSVSYMYIDIFNYQTCAITKISTVVGYHVVLAMLLFSDKFISCIILSGINLKKK